ncbi:asparagine synthase (glutamine-hydrolyzing) [[Clostridium] fimetarium]|uniref:asparagine synthase (glutamine-hydrolyzing) n=1 Tax=[Clostridium] fimetarium TaxID=99656 RepID=A0A1I0R292_9FIRM|nr:asparagine synthase (glutamine-hydrolyzing) [[Clostridium] fimetarium]SEW34478.1 asparagine synthase (glutamine-hydrolysing) [[Clostridium] fimetarium]
MCGFVGFTGYLEDGENVLTNMMNKIIHRGPDSAGQHMDGKAYLGFRRLSIIDLDNGSQPMYNETNDVVIVFNGEIYNHMDLREDLLSKGHIFKNNSDTEVLIHAYEEYGEAMLQKLRGMFSFVIWDSKNDTIFGARDFFGIKPFYYAVVDGNLVFASEIKSILSYPKYEKAVNDVALENYLTFQYSVLEETFFKGIYKLMPSHFLTFKGGELNVKRYWEPKFEADDNASLDVIIENIDKAMHDSIEHHKISDVEVGSFLSSGVDSSYVAATFNGDKTFTVGFDYDKYNEIDYAKALSKEIKIDNYSKLITTEEYWGAISKIQYHMDEPLADPSAIALYFVSQTAAQHVKVALSGEGADEFFGGYNIYREPFALKPMQKIPKPIRVLIGKVASLIPFKIKGKNYLIRASKKLEERFIGNAFMFNEKERSKILKNPTGKFNHMDLTKPFYDKVKGLDDVTRMQYIDINFWLIGDILLKADKMSMAHSLEVRVPFLDKEVFEVARHIPTKYKVNKENTKYAMRMAAHRYLPDMVAEKKKLGFPVPIRIWLRDDKYYNIVKTSFTSEAAQKYFNTDVIVKFLDDHKNGKEDNSRKIWTVYMFLVWYEEFFGNALSNA